MAFIKSTSYSTGETAPKELMIWTVAEPAIYLLAACLLTYRPLLEKIMGSKLVVKLSQALSKGLSYASTKSTSSGRSRGTQVDIQLTDKMQTVRVAGPYSPV